MKIRKALQCGAWSIAICLSVMNLGCDRTVVEDTKVKQGPNGTSIEEKKVVEHPDGTVTEQKETHTSETRSK